MKQYEFTAKVSKNSDRLKGKVYNPKGFYYQGKNNKFIILVGDVATGDTTRIKLLTEDVEISVKEI